MIATHSLQLLGMDLEDLSSSGALERLRETSPAAYTMLAQWENLRAEVAKTPTDRERQWVVARRLRDTYNLPERLTLEKIYRRLRNQVKAARRVVMELFREYLPDELLRKVALQPLNLDPVMLIELGLPGQLSFTFESKQFEARRSLILGLLFFDITALQWTGRDQASDPEQLTRFLVEASILTGFPKERDLFSFHDPAQEYRCVGIEEFAEPTSREGLLPIKNRVRVAKLYVEEMPITIFYHVRVKKPISLIRRMLVDQQWNPQRVHDLRAFRFCYMRDKYLLRGYPAVASRLLPGATSVVKDRFTEARLPNPNQHSAAEFRDIEHEARILDRTYQVQHLLATTLFDIEHSHAPISHRRYHARQMCEIDPPGLFCCLAPFQGYGVDWTNESVRNQIDAHILASLPR